MSTTLEYDEFLQIWTFSEHSALDLFGLNPNHYSVTILKDKPTTEREIERYKPECKLFGIKAIQVVDYYTIEIPYVDSTHATPWHPTTNVGPFATLTRGVFSSTLDAIRWGQRELCGTPYTVKPIMRLAADKPTLTLTTNDIINGPDDTGRFAVDDTLVLRADCELGNVGERFIVEDIDGPYMTIIREECVNQERSIRDNHGRIHTGRDYKHLSLASGDVSPYQRSVNRLSAR